MARSGRASSSLRVFTALASNRPLTRVAAAYAVFVVTEYAVWIAMVVYAFGRGGLRTAGLVVLAQLIPAAIAAPLVATVADRRSPVLLLTGGYLVQAAGMAVAAAAMFAGATPFAYAGAVLAAVAVTTTRPAQAPLLPALASTPEQLTAANVALGWLESVAEAIAGLLCGVLLALVGPAGVFAACAGLVLVGPALVGGLRVTPAELVCDAAANADTTLLSGLVAGLRLAAADDAVRLLVALGTAVAVVIGALDLLYVVLAVDVLHRGTAWTGYLSTAVGIGAMLSGLVTVLLVGRRLGRVMLAAAGVVSLAAAALVTYPGLGGTVVLLGVLGAGLAVLTVTTRTLLQRTVPARETGRLFGVLEGLYMAGLAVGTMLVSGLETWVGVRGTVLAVALALPLAALAGGRSLFRLDDEARVPVVQIALLRSLPLFAELPLPTLEGLAAQLRPVRLGAGDVLIREGEPGQEYYAIAEGELAVSQGGRSLRRCGRGEGVGEIGLLRDIPRTATVVAICPSTIYALDRAAFLDAVTRHGATRSRAARIAETRLAAG